MAGTKGRIPGSKNRRTLYREAKERAAQATAKLEDAAINGNDFIGESLAVMGEAMYVFVTQARREKDYAQKRDCYVDAFTVADKLARFRYPVLAAVHTSTARENVLHREGITEREVQAELIEEIANSGRLPRKIIEFLQSYGFGKSRPMMAPPGAAAPAPPDLRIPNGSRSPALVMATPPR